MSRMSAVKTLSLLGWTPTDPGQSSHPKWVREVRGGYLFASVMDWQCNNRSRRAVKLEFVPCAERSMCGQLHDRDRDRSIDMSEIVDARLQFYEPDWQVTVHVGLSVLSIVRIEGVLL